MAYQFAGTNTLTRTGIPISDAPFTFHCWSKPSAALQGSDLMAIWRSASNYYTMHQNASGQLVVFARDESGGNNAAAASANLFSTNWNHCINTYSGDRTTITTRLNGGTKAVNASSVPVQSGNVIYIGRIVNVNDASNGGIGEAAMWSAVLTDDEQTALARGASPYSVRPQSLYVYYPMGRNDRVGSTHLDRGPRGLHLTESAALAVIDHPPVAASAGRSRIYLPGEAPVTVPALPTPTDGATGVLLPVALSWVSLNATLFDVYFGTTSTPPLVASNLLTPTYTPTIPANDGTVYYWRVVAKNGVSSQTGAVWSFTMAAPPPAPSAPHPLDGAAHVPASTSLSWSGPGADYYKVYFGETDPPPLIDAHHVPPYFLGPDVEQGRRYYWRIESVNAAGSTLGPVWSFVISVGPVFVGGVGVEQQLGVGFRSRLITEAYNVGTWPLSEMARIRAADISGRNHHGVWVGSGFTSPIPFEVPGGALGTRFTRQGYVEIADTSAGDSNLSLAGGDIDLAILVRDYQRDSTRRALIAKHDGARLTGNGWYLALMDGAVEFSLVVGGIVIFRFQRGAVDTGERLITACYRTIDSGSTRFAFLALDGAVALPIVTFGTLPPEPQVTAAPVRVGHFCDGVAGDDGGIDAALAYASIGREGDDTLGPQLQLQRVWTNITPHVRTAVALQTRTGISGNGPDDNVATSGTFNYTLDNGYRVPIGHYTPGHPNMRAGFGVGNAVRVWFDFGGIRHYEFVGRLASVTPLAGLHLGRQSDCQATDWIDVAASTPMGVIPTQLNARSDHVVRAVLDQAQGRVPVNVDIKVGSATFPFAIDEGETERETLLTELSRDIASERGFAYIKGDETRGGLLVVEGHASRIGLPIRAAFDNTMQGLEVSWSLDALVNIVKMTYTPRKVDGTVATLYALDISQRPEVVQPGETRVFEGGYVDPLNEAESVGGTQIVPVVVGTDIAMNAASDGSGASLNANLQLVQALGGNSYRLEVTNTHATAPGYLRLNATTAFQIRGKAIKHYKPVTIERRDNTSVRTRGPRLLEIDLPYESDGAVATALAEFYLEVYGTEQPVPSSLRLAANKTASMMRAALALQPGDRIALGEPMTGLTVAARTFIIHEKRLDYSEPGILFATFTLAPTPLSLTLRRPLGSQGAAA